MWQPINPIKYKKKKKQHETKLEYKEDTTNYQMTKQEWNENISMLHSEVEQKFNSLWSGFADNKAATKIGLSDYHFS